MSQWKKGGKYNSLKSQYHQYSCINNHMRQQ